MMRRVGVFAAYVDFLLCIVALLIVSVAPKKAQEGAKVEAEYLISIEWDRMLDDDIDLWALGPPHNDQPVYYKSREYGAMHLDRDSRGWMDDKQVIDGQVIYLPHKEIITVRGIIPGTYAFAAHYYSPHGVGSHDVKVHWEVVKINPVATTIGRGEIDLPSQGVGENFWSMEVARDGSFTPLDLPVKPIPNQFYSTHNPESAVAPSGVSP